jgi:hypothetical protein
MKFLRLFRAVLREIFDEAAYERFCQQEQLPAGQQSYSRFVQQMKNRSRQRIRCC